MVILGIETSCDETGAAVLKGDPSVNSGQVQILSNVVASSASLQAKYGGIIPEQAAREQIKSIIPVIEEALGQAFPKERLSRRGVYPERSRRAPRNDEMKIDAIAVTYGPGLIGSLLVGVETAKTLSLVWDKPLIPINHLIGHFYANWITPFVIPSERSSRGNLDSKQIATVRSVDMNVPRNDDFEVPTFPCLGLLVSGGHTDLVLFTNHGKYKYLGGTRDDAAGECFDKCARLLGLPYPGGPQISKLAQKGDPKKFKLPIPMKGSKDLDFSYSGLKTAVASLLHTSEVKARLQQGYTSEVKQDLAASIEDVIVQSLVDKVMLALKTYPVKSLMIAGGVAANQRLTDHLKFEIGNLKFEIPLHIPPPNLCTDNAAMIAAAGFFEKKRANPLTLQADPNLSLSY